MTNFWIKVAAATVLIVGMGGVAISHDLSKQRAIEAKHRQETFCHQFFDYHRAMYLETRDIKYLRRLQNLKEDTVPCEEFFNARLNDVY